MSFTSAIFFISHFKELFGSTYKHKLVNGFEKSIDVFPGSSGMLRERKLVQGQRLIPRETKKSFIRNPNDVGEEHKEVSIRRAISSEMREEFQKTTLFVDTRKRALEPCENRFLLQCIC